MSSDQITKYFGMLYDMALPVLLVLAVAFLLLPKLLESSSKPHLTARAYFCHLMEVIGVFLMSLSAMQTMVNVLDTFFLTGQSYSAQQYLSMLIMFSTGGFLFLWCDQQIQEIDEDARRVPDLIYLFFMKAVGHLSLVFAALALAWTVALGIENFAGWWVVPFVLLVFGSVLSWLTASEDYKIPVLSDIIHMKPERPAPKMVRRSLKAKAR